MKVTETELNLAYTKVNKYKNDNSDNLSELVEVCIERNPLVDEGFFAEDSDYVTPFRLVFKFDKSMGPKGAYVLATENIEIVEETDDNTD